MSDSRRGFGLDIGFIDHFNTRLVITLTYSDIVNFHSLQITRAHVNSFPACSIFTSMCLVRVSNNGYSSASWLRSSLNGGSIPTASSQSQSQSYFTTGGLPPISLSWRQVPWDPRPAIFFQLNTCGHGPYVTSSLTRGWVCRLQLLMAFAIAVILRSETRGTRDHILLSQIRDSPNLEGQILVFIYPRNRVPQLYPHALGSLFVAS
jgi:hypothetical protein